MLAVVADASKQGRIGVASVGVHEREMCTKRQLLSRGERGNQIVAFTRVKIPRDNSVVMGTKPLYELVVSSYYLFGQFEEPHLLR